MSDLDHLKILLRGVESWNTWRQENPQIIPDLAGANLQGKNLAGANLIRVNLKDANISGANTFNPYHDHWDMELEYSLADTWREENPIIFTNLAKANLTKANLMGANLSEVNLSEAVLVEANLERAQLKKAQLQDACLIGACLIGADLDFIDLTGANLMNANLTGVNGSHANLTNVNLEGACCKESKFLSADLSHANLNKTDFSNADLSEVRLTGANLKKTILSATCLENANLRGVSLAGNIIWGADFSEADLSSADLRKTVFDRANLMKADLTGANLTCAQLMEGNIGNANLTETDLTATNFMKASLVGASLIRANCLRTNFIGADISDSSVSGISIIDIEKSGLKQENLTITDDRDIAISIDNLELAHFISFIINNKKSQHVKETPLMNAVLILSSALYPHKRDFPWVLAQYDRTMLLEAIKNELRRHGYLPILCTFKPSPKEDITEIIHLLSSLSLFIIADITNPSNTPRELKETKGKPILPLFGGEEPYLYYTYPMEFKTPVVSIIQKDDTPFFKFTNNGGEIRKEPQPPFVFESIEQLIENFDTAIINRALEVEKMLLLEKARRTIQMLTEDDLGPIVE